MNERVNGIWKGQALKMAQFELLNIHKGVELMDLNLLFKRAEQIYKKAFYCGFFDWEPPEGKDIKEKCDWVECKKCHQLADRAHYEYCKCGENIPPKE